MARNVTCLFCDGEVGTPFPTHGYVVCMSCVHRVIDFWAIGFLKEPCEHHHHVIIHGMPMRQEYPTTREGA